MAAPADDDPLQFADLALEDATNTLADAPVFAAPPLAPPAEEEPPPPYESVMHGSSTSAAAAVVGASVRRV